MLRAVVGPGWVSFNMPPQPGAVAGTPTGTLASGMQSRRFSPPQKHGASVCKEPGRATEQGMEQVGGPLKYRDLAHYTRTRARKRDSQAEATGNNRYEA